VPDSEKNSELSILRDRVDKLEYIEQMLRELCKLTNDLDAAMLIYLLEMASIEASDALKSAQQAGTLLSGSG
jgi:hypothetical protein